jgi:hypothetical protein
MTEQAPKYPVGIQIFEKIRRSGYVYVDKTDLIYKLTHEFECVFLSRPRRFGKTLLTRTMESYFEGKKELFAGLAMETLETEWTEHPVLRFDFGGLKVETVGELRERLDGILDSYEKIYGRNPKETSIGGRFASLIRKAWEQTGRGVVLLIDEYDVPMQQVLMQPDKKEEVRTVMRSFFSQIKPSEDYLRFVFLTGISTFSQLGMFSELNNLVNITNMDDYAAICGITLDELTSNFGYGISKLAVKAKCSEAETIDMLREQYDGYHFTENMVDVFNPYSLLNAFVSGRMDDFWFQTGTPTLAIDMLKEHKGQWTFRIEDIDGLPAMSLADFNTPLELADDPIPFFYQAGYLTIKSYDERSRKYVLGVPNTEVRIGLLRNLMPLYTAMNPKDTFNMATDVSLALSDGHYDEALRLVQSFMAEIPASRRQTGYHREDA